ncbi:glycine cleavage system protein R [Alteromonas lipotrueiana]|uniref:glycine cleavage system protein R n=1 Tax=Alteromonas lipotrueiana TaxID=2803815 RepID=UPI001C48E54E|nr:glycine cleavage system transcriptional repressor [Alteromonas lipotrueiana]
MNQQLIVTILGSDRSGILSELATLMSEAQCNILDSRQAIYGQEFSLTMILEGEHTAITRAECMIPTLCQRLDLLSMMKRTRHHAKQNLEHLFDVEFQGKDAAGLIKAVTGFFAQRQASISAFRQRVYPDNAGQQQEMRCNFVVNAPDSINFDELQKELMALFDSLNVTGKVVDKHNKETHEHTSSW